MSANKCVAPTALAIFNSSGSQPSPAGLASNAPPVLGATGSTSPSISTIATSTSSQVEAGERSVIDSHLTSPSAGGAKDVSPTRKGWETKTHDSRFRAPEARHKLAQPARAGKQKDAKHVPIAGCISVGATRAARQSARRAHHRFSGLTPKNVQGTTLIPNLYLCTGARKNRSR